jgi:hypothetical protein
MARETNCELSEPAIIYFMCLRHFQFVAGVNAEGVCKFQPRATPWEKSVLRFQTSERVREFGRAFETMSIGNPFRVANNRLPNTRVARCARNPGLEFENAFGVNPQRVCQVDNLDSSVGYFHSSASPTFIASHSPAVANKRDALTVW